MHILINHFNNICMRIGIIIAIRHERSRDNSTGTLKAAMKKARPRAPLAPALIADPAADAQKAVAPRERGLARLLPQLRRLPVALPRGAWAPGRRARRARGGACTARGLGVAAHGADVM